MFDFVYYLKAHFLVKRKKWKEALNIYKKIVKGKDSPSVQLAYRIGFLSEKTKDWNAAEKWLATVVENGPAKAQWFYRMALAQEMNKKFVLAAENYAKATELQPRNTKYFYRLGKVLRIAGKGEAAEKALQQALALEPNNALYAYELAMAIRKQGRTWQEIEALQAALEIDPSNAQWQFELAEAQDKMNRFAEAAESFAKANKLQPGNAVWLFREGWAWERAEQEARAQAAYASAINADQSLEAKNFGVGVFHQQRGDWQHVARAYEHAVEENSGNAELHYRLGMAYDRCYQWQKAVMHYRQALVINSQKPEWHYRLGFVLERLEHWDEASKAYEYAATTRSTHTPDWFYRLGYVLLKAGDYEAACHAFLNTRTLPILESAPMAHIQTHLSKDYEEQLKVNILAAAEQMQVNALLSHEKAQAFYKLGNQAEILKIWEYAANAYRAAIARTNEHQSLWYYRLGYVLVQQGKWHEAALAFLNTRIFKQAHGIDMSRYEENAGLMQLMEYTEYLETLSIQKNSILYESFLGASLGCNPYAIYQSIIDRPEFQEFTHIWVVGEETKLPFDFFQRPNVILIKRNSSAYRRYLATAEYLINNVTFPIWFIRREEQKYLNTWHGTPLKGLGKDMPGEFLVHGNVTRNFLHATHMISPNFHTSEVLIKSYDVAGIFNGLLAETGYPRIDKTLNSSNNEKNNIKKHLGLQDDLPVVLYAPTWRGTQGNVQTDIEKILEDVKYLQSEDYQLVFRGHHFAENALKSIGLPVAVAGQEVDANELLAVADVLVTDYSSIFFDFLPKKRPIVYYAYDLDEYSATRGLYFDLQSMPGTLCRTRQEAWDAIHQSIENPEDYFSDERYQLACEKFSNFEDGKSTQRVVDFFFHDVKINTVNRYCDERKVVLFYNGKFLPNGITSSFLNLLNSLPKDQYLKAIALEPGLIRNDSDLMGKISSLQMDMQILAKEGRILVSPEEAWIENQFLKYGFSLDKAMQQSHHKIYEREFRRLYGVKNKIEKIINFEGYNAYWAQLLAHSGQNKESFIWLHNDMLGEYKLKFPYLERNFAAYPYYKKVVSVSALMSEINGYSLSEMLDMPIKKFTFCENPINTDEILSKAQEPLDEDLRPWLSSTAFLSIGRMSPEKDQEKLIRAFAQVKSSAPQAKLIILGDGPLRNHLERVILDLGLQNSVLLAGQRSNPFPALKACSCFVLSSNHEGQPMVLLEALTLGKKIIATDIDGNRGVLSKCKGHLVENSVAGIAQAMLDFINGKIADTHFNAKTYCQSAINMFINTIE